MLAAGVDGARRFARIAWTAIAVSPVAAVAPAARLVAAAILLRRAWLLRRTRLLWRARLLLRRARLLRRPGLVRLLWRCSLRSLRGRLLTLTPTTSSTTLSRCITRRGSTVWCGLVRPVVSLGRAGLGGVVPAVVDGLVGTHDTRSCCASCAINASIASCAFAL